MAPASQLTVRQVIDRIRSRLGVDWMDATVDGFKAGDPESRVNGIATTMFPTLDVLRRSAQRRLNLVIAHEPTFYSHHDDPKHLHADPVLQAKRELIADRGLVVWRFHDHIHCMRPDGINAGMIKALGWHERIVGDARGYEVVFELPKTTLRELAAQVKQKLAVRCVRVVGDPNLRCSRIGLCAGAPPSSMQIQLLARDDVEVLLAGETREWETVEYARDAATLGSKGLILLGHNASEEAGMRWAAEWIGSFVTEVPVQFIPSGEPYWPA